MSTHDDTNHEQIDDQIQSEDELSDEDLEDAAGGCWAPGPIILEPPTGPTFPDPLL